MPTELRQGIPQELCEAILENLKSERSDLMSCALVSQTFCASSQRLLFEALWLRPPPHTAFLAQRTMCDKFLDLIQEVPHIASLVKEVSIDAGDHDKSWLLTDNSLVPILQSIPSLRSISLLYSNIFKKIEWGALPKPLREALKSTFQRRELTSITISRMFFWKLDIPVTVFNGCMNLKKMSLTGCRIPPPPAETDPGDARPQLETLELLWGSASKATDGCSFSTVEHIFDLSHLKELSINVGHPDDCQILWNFISRPKSVLSKLSVWFSFHYGFVSLPVPDISRLRFFRTQMNIDGEPALATSIRWWTTLFAALPEGNRLTIIELCLKCPFAEDGLDLNPPEWAALESALMRREMRGVKKITIFVQTNPVVWKTLVDSDALSLLKGQGVVELSRITGSHRFT